MYKKEKIRNSGTLSLRKKVSKGRDYYCFIIFSGCTFTFTQKNLICIKKGGKRINNAT
jgi:hypothetical protein